MATLEYEERFSGWNNLVSGQELSSAGKSGQYETNLPPNEGTLYLSLKVVKGDTLTTTLKLGLSASRKTVLSARDVNVDVSLTLKGVRSSTESITLGVESDMNGITQQYFEQNPTLKIRWPLSWTKLSEYTDSNGDLRFEVVVNLKNAESEQTVVDEDDFSQRPISAPSFPMEQRPSSGGFPIEQRPVGSFFPSGAQRPNNQAPYYGGFFG